MLYLKEVGVKRQAAAIEAAGGPEAFVAVNGAGGDGGDDDDGNKEKETANAISTAAATVL